MAQGKRSDTLGRLHHPHTTPCNGKSVSNALCFNAFALAGRMVALPFYPGRRFACRWAMNFCPFRGVFDTPSIEHARTEIAQHVNGYVSTAYWEIGQMLHERKIESGYGDRVVRRLSADLKERYPKMGVSPRQLWNMKKLYERYAGHDEKVLRSVALLPWSHNLLLLSKGLNDETTLYYAQETVTKGWNRDLLLNAIKLNMYETQALARVDNNFDRTLPAEQAQYANEVFGSSYNLGFLGVTSPILEFELHYVQ